MYGLEDIRAHDPMESARYVGMLALVAGYNTSTYFAMWPNTTTTLLDYLNVRYFVTGPGRELDQARFTKIYDAADGRIFQNQPVLAVLDQFGGAGLPADNYREPAGHCLCHNHRKGIVWAGQQEGIGRVFHKRAGFGTAAYIRRPAAT